MRNIEIFLITIIFIIFQSCIVNKKVDEVEGAIDTIEDIIDEGEKSSGGKVTLPTRATFYYPWYPETWSVEGKDVFYKPYLGKYKSIDKDVIDYHLKSMEYAKIKVAIASWWGEGTTTDKRFPLLLERTQAINSNIKWTIYYEKAGFENHDTSLAALKKDFSYLKKYLDDTSFAYVNDKPVMFVYNKAKNSCDLINRYLQATSKEWYLVLKVFEGYKDCPNQPDSWHQYGPDNPAQKHGEDSFAISPGFWRADHGSATLERNVDRWYKNVKEMVDSRALWQLVVTFNEWGEGTAVELATGDNGWESSSSEYGHYLEALNKDGIK